MIFNIAKLQHDTYADETEEDEKILSEYSRKITNRNICAKRQKKPE